MAPIRLTVTAAAAGLYAGLLAVGSPASAQTVLTSPQAIAECLCLERQVVARQSQVELARRALEQARTETEQLQRQVELQRVGVRATDPNSVAAFRDLLHASEDRMSRYNNQDVPAYNRAVDAHRQVSDRYALSCGGRAYDALVLEQVRPSLSCPGG
jgi:hypothetical protein